MSFSDHICASNQHVFITYPLINILCSTWKVIESLLSYTITTTANSRALLPTQADKHLFQEWDFNYLEFSSYSQGQFASFTPVIVHVLGFKQKIPNNGSIMILKKTELELFHFWHSVYDHLYFCLTCKTVRGRANWNIILLFARLQIVVHIWSVYGIWLISLKLIFIFKLLIFVLN